MRGNLTYKNLPVKEKPWFVGLPLTEPRGVAFLSKIYLRKDLFQNYISGLFDPQTLSVLEHEAKHIWRSKEIGMVKSIILYWLFPSVRLKEELMAIEEEMKVLKNYSQEFDIEKRAKRLSGPPYLWAISYKEACKQLGELWYHI